MKIERMRNIPSSRAELERHLFLLGEALKSGKMRFASGLSLDGLRRLRKLPNGRVDLLSLDEMTRLKANMMANMPNFSVPAVQQVGESTEEQEERLEENDI